MRDDIGVLHAQALDKLSEQCGSIVQGEWNLPPTLAEADQINSIDCVVLRQRGQITLPPRSARREAVDEQERWSIALLRITQSMLADVTLLNVNWRVMRHSDTQSYDSGRSSHVNERAKVASTSLGANKLNPIRNRSAQVT